MKQISDLTKWQPGPKKAVKSCTTLSKRPSKTSQKAHTALDTKEFLENLRPNDALIMPSEELQSQFGHPQFLISEMPSLRLMKEMEL